MNAKTKGKAKAQSNAIEADDETELGNIGVPINISATDSQHDAFAISLSDKIMSNEVVESLEIYAQAKFHTATIPLRLYVQLVDALEENDLSFDDLPLVGKNEKDVEGTNYRPEVWTIKTVKANGEASKTRHHFFSVMFGRTEVGKKLRADAEAAKLIQDKSVREATEKTINTSFNNRVEALRKAVKLGQSIAHVKKTFPKLEVTFLTTEDGDGVEQLRDVLEPIVVSEKGKPQNFDTLGATKFVKMPWEQVEKEGGTFANFHSAYVKSKAKGAGAAAKASVKIAITNLQQLNAYVSAFATLLDEENEPLFNQLMKEANKDEATVIAIRDANVVLIRMAAATEAKRIAIETRENEAIKAKAANK